MFGIFSAFFLFIVLAMSSAVAGPTLEDEAALRHIKEVDWPTAYREQKSELLDRILAAEFQMIDADGASSSKAEELEYVRKNKPSYDSFRFEIKRLEVFENDCAVVGGTGFITERRGGAEVVTQYQSTNVFIKRDRRWQAIASHVSGVKEHASTGDTNDPGH
jgi:Domain of unknown function (DUF4440)